MGILKLNIYKYKAVLLKIFSRRFYSSKKDNTMNFWIFASNKLIIAYGETPVIKANSAVMARLIVSELNTGLPKTLKLSGDGKYILKDGVCIATVVAKNNFIISLFTPKPKPQPKPQPEIEEPIIVEEIPEEEIKVEEKVEEPIKVEEPVVVFEQPAVSLKVVEKPVEINDYTIPQLLSEKDEIIEEPVVIEEEKPIEEPAVIEEVKPEPVEEKIEEEKPKKKRKYTRKKKQK